MANANSEPEVNDLIHGMPNRLQAGLTTSLRAANSPCRRHRHLAHGEFAPGSGSGHAALLGIAEHIEVWGQLKQVVRMRGIAKPGCRLTRTRAGWSTSSTGCVQGAGRIALGAG